MSLLDDFKIRIGETDTTNDIYLTSNYLNPAIRKSNNYIYNLKTTTLTLSLNKTLYDISVDASPPITDSLINSYFHKDIVLPFIFGEDVFIKNKTFIEFVSTDLVFVGICELIFDVYWSDIVVDPAYIETNAPEEIFPYILKLAVASFQKDSLFGGNFGVGGITNAGIKRREEDGVEEELSDINGQLAFIKSNIEDAIKGFQDFGNTTGNSKDNNVYNFNMLI